MDDRLLTVDEAAGMLGRTPHAVYRLVARRRLPYRKDGRRLLFLESELRDYITQLPGLTADEARARLGEVSP